MAYYSGTIAEIKVLMKQINVGDEKIDTITDAQIIQYQAEVDGLINSTLSVCYETPLKQITRQSVTSYPPLIMYIARRLVASEIIMNEMTEIEPNTSQAASALRERAQAELLDCVNGALVGSKQIEGQRLRARNHFVRPTIAPNQPPTTTPNKITGT